VHRHRDDRHALAPGLDQHLDRIAETRNDVQPECRLARDGAKAGDRIGHVGAREQAHDAAAERLQEFLGSRKMFDRGGLPVADDDIGAAVEYRPDQSRDIVRLVLVVAVGVDDDVGAARETGIEPGCERRGEAAIARMAHDVIGAAGARDVGRAVARAVVDHQDLDPVDAVDAARNGGDGRRQAFRLVEAGNLDDQRRHGAVGFCSTTQ
jgi:hypothetical protein